MMEYPLLSIIVPVYRVEKYLRKCIDSILNQTYPRIELILVDDGSDDGCGRICDEVSEKDSRVRVLHQKNQGQAAARNNGLKIANGELVAFVDSDDFIAPQTYLTMYERMEIDQTDLALCGIQYVSEDGHNIKDSIDITDSIWNEEQYWTEMYYQKNYTYCVALWNKLYKKSLFNKVEFPDNRISEDEAIAHRIISQVDRMTCISEKMYFYVQRKDSEMGRKFNLKLLDTVKAIAERSLYFMEKGWTDRAETAFTYGIGFFLKIYNADEMKITDNLSIYNTYKKYYQRKFYQICMMGHTHIKFKVNIATFLISERLYYFTRRFCR